MVERQGAPRATLLVADDDQGFRFAVAKALRRMGFAVEEAACGEEAVRALRCGSADIALLDLQLGDLDGLSVLDRAQGTRTRVIVVTGHGTIPTAVEAMRSGASGFVQKPVDAPQLLPLIEQLLRERPASSCPLKADDLGLCGPSPALARVRESIRRLGPTGDPVLILGESGVGKELVARALHRLSGRGGPFVPLNCALAHRELFESELFGHVRGAFTGASADRPGLFQTAEEGTLFLDEVGELPEAAQAKLLRAVEGGAVRRVGSSVEETVNARVIAATNRDLASAANEGRFRADLLYRLNVLSIWVPPLRERKEDVLPIAECLLAAAGLTRGRTFALAADAAAELTTYDWPGNVRELASVVKRMIAFAERDLLDAALVRDALRASIFGHPAARAARPLPPAELTLAELERRHVEATVDRLGGNLTRAAQALGIDRRTLQRKLRALGRGAGED